MYCTTTLTPETISADALSDQQMTLPQDGPHQVTRPTANLHNLPWYGHLLPIGALRIMVINATPEPHLLEYKKKNIFWVPFLKINGHDANFYLCSKNQ